VVISDEEIALACASHKGAAWHLAPIAAWLERLGFEERHLQCGAHPPADATELARLQREGREPSALHNNCSGKHCAMLALAQSLGADPKSYLHGSQPTQQHIRACVETVAGHGRPSRLSWGVDGCSAPTPAMPLQRLAASYARLAAAEAPTPEATPFAALPAAPTVDTPPLDRMANDMARVFRAMRTHAELVGGTGILDTVLMRSLEHTVAKRGADGVYAMAFTHTDHGPLGLALKIEDGSNDARDTAVLAVLEQFGRLNPASRFALAPFIRPRRLNARGLVVGHYEAELELQWNQ